MTRIIHSDSLNKMDIPKAYIIAAIVIALSLILFILWKKMKTNHPTTAEKDPRLEPRIVKKELQKIENEQSDDHLSDKQMFVLAEIYHYGRYGKSINMDRAIELYNKSAEKSTDIKHIGNCYMGIARAYKEGWKGQYPDAGKAVNWFLKSIECGYEDALIYVAHIYMYGLHPNYLPDKLTAGKIYNIIIFNKQISESARSVCNDQLKEITKMRYNDLDAEPERGRTYYTLPSNIDHHITISIDTANTKQVECIPSAIYKTVKPKNIHTVNTRIAIIEPPDNENILDIIPVQNVYNDLQNVHSTTVQNAAKNTVDYIEQKTSHVTNYTNSFNQFMHEIDYDTSIKEVDRENIRKVLYSFSDTSHSRYGKSEKDIFNLVWSRINDPVNNDRRSDMIKVFADNISSAVERDHIVCSTGKIVRMIGSLDGIDAEPLLSLKPEWAINEEIATTASNIREKVLEFATEKEKSAYEALNQTDEQKQLAENLSNIMKAELLQKCKTEYVDSNIMSEETLHEKLADYIDSM